MIDLYNPLVQVLLGIVALATIVSLLTAIGGKVKLKDIVLTILDLSSVLFFYIALLAISVWVTISVYHFYLDLRP